MSDTEQITTAIYDDWAEIRRVLAIKRGEHWDEQLPGDLELVVKDDGVWFRFGDLSYTRNPATGQVYESRIEKKTVLVSVFDQDGELGEASTVPLDKFKLVQLDNE